MSGTSIAPLFLRLVLAVTFLWAGFGKVLQSMPVRGEPAAILANMGVGSVISAAKSPSESVTPPTTSTPAPASSNNVSSTSRETEDNAKKPAANETTVVNGSRTFTAADFPDEVRVMRLNGLALLLHKSAHPPEVDGKAKMPLWPASLATDSIPLYFAWAAAITEIVGGLFVLVGLLTRVSALALAGTMLTAMWLTELGPAIQAGDTFMGLLPAYGAYAVDEVGKFKFMTLLWQFALLGCGMALVFAGPGYLSFDRALFPGKPKEAAE